MEPSPKDVSKKGADQGPKGLVLRSTGSWYEVMELSTGTVISCRIQGKLRLRGERSTNPIAVGDYVLIQKQDEEKKNPDKKGDQPDDEGEKDKSKEGKEEKANQKGEEKGEERDTSFLSKP